MGGDKTNGELAIMIENISENVNGYNSENTETHNILFKELKETNYRILGLEKWRYLITGGLGVLTAIIIPLAFLILKEMVFRP